MNEPPHPEVAILNAALELREPERTAYLDKACADDGALRQRVEELLRAHEQAKDFLEAPPAGIIFKRTNLANVPVAEKAGDKIGRYKLLEQIGEGGCGVVYVAEQQEPVRRRVALKIIKLGMDTKQVIARFEAERQALALMDHPNIARVFDAGATETGRPYFVMELVRGVKITEYCDQNHLSARERLDLFIQVCRAVQHAHQKGVIHRDIKPSNILVTVNDGVPVPKVIDFGIAKATQGRLTDQTVYTAFEQFIGTPAYMSPEQAAMTSLDIDTRSDIYSLGVLLYELLTGKTPFDQKKLLATGLDEMRRTIREIEPVKPSTRLTQEITSKSEIKSEIRNRQSAIPSDLDWIVMKCLEKDRGRRYETANGLARDIERHLNCEPVIARPPSKLYEFQKTVRRHKVGFAATAAVIASLLIGLGISSWMFVNERKARQQAQTEGVKSQQVARFLQEMLAGVGPKVAKGRDTTILKEILDKAYERIGKELTNQPEVQVELLNTIGSIYLDLGLRGQAMSMHRQALAIARRFLGNDNLAAAQAMEGLATSINYMNAPEDEQREPLLRECLRIRKQLLGPDHPDVAKALDSLSHFLAESGRAAEAEPLARDALRIQRKVFGETNETVATSLKYLGLSLEGQSKLEESESAYREAIAITKALGNESQLAGLINNFANTLHTEATLLDRVPGQEAAADAKYAQTEAAYHESLELGWRFSQYNAPMAPLNNLSVLLYSQGKLEETERLFDDAMRSAASDTTAQWEILRSWSSYRIREGRFAAAAADLARAVEINPDAEWGSSGGLIGTLAISGDFSAYTNYCRQRLDRARDSTDPYCLGRTAIDCLLLPSSDSQIEAASTFSTQAVAVAAKNRLTNELVFAPQALADYRRGRFAEAVEWIRQHPPRGPAPGSRAFPYAMGADVEMEAVLAMSYQRLGQSDEAKAALSRAIGRARVNLPNPHNWHFTAGDYQDWLAAHVLLREAKTVVEGRTSPNEYGDLIGYLVDCAAFAAKRGRLQEAETLSREAVALCPTNSDDPDPWLACALYRSSVVLKQLPEAQQMADRGQAIGNSLLSSNDGDAAGLIELAWLLATSNEPQIRDGTNAVAFAERAVAATQRKAPSFLDTLAAAYAESGEFAKAVSTEKEALTLNHNQALNDELGFHLSLFESGSPYHAPGRDVRQELEQYRRVCDSGNTYALNGAAWLLATCPDSTVRDGQAAVSYAEKAVAATSRTNANYLDTLAAAYAEAGAFTNAITAQKEAIALNKVPAYTEGMKARLNLYQTNTPYRRGN